MMKKMDQINVIPFIDIMLVLLAIVLTTATFLVEGRLQIRLPTAANEDTPGQLNPLEIAIGADGEVFFQAESLGVGAPGLAALAPHLAALQPATQIVLRVDAQTPFAAFIAVVDQLKARGLERLSILTRRP
ncbi:biopolymer transporter ExbD [uncultured Thiodictyon sp.]|jgi:biopolymer transport protein ExbD|uniref:ExbD/TolR family protein n=1 Tax=uncultured Thiodictyon sp. TaxID=1846217 RepID=UPI0025E1D841|nr:biopolymer transporter ExbD [uncultured Thiodictyon sp.]